MHRNSERAARLDELRREVAAGLVDAIRGTKEVEQLEFLAIAVAFLDDCGVNRPALNSTDYAPLVELTVRSPHQRPA